VDEAQQDTDAQADRYVDIAVETQATDCSVIAKFVLAELGWLTNQRKESSR
jgi:hypothetical protein